MAAIADPDHENAPDAPDFEEIFETIDREKMRERILQLSWQQFEAFVQYMFECAGYTVRSVSSNHTRHHVDLLLFDQSGATDQPWAHVEVRHYRAARIRSGAILKFVGALDVRGMTRGYLVTTSAFVEPAKATAREAAERGKQVSLIDGDHLTRYITYLHGSRRDEADGRRRTPAPTPPDWLLVADALPRRDPRQTTILAIANNKGGVAKTTTALNLAIALTHQHHRVLLIDLDGQASLSTALPLLDPRRHPPRNAPRTPLPTREKFLRDYFSGKSALAELVQPTRFPFLWLIPAHADLYARDPGGAAQPEAEVAFVRAVHDQALATPTGPTGIPGAGTFDWIILDTPPAQSGYTRAALAASHYILIPAAMETFAVESINRLLATARAMSGLMGRDVRLLGCTITRRDRRSASAQSDLDELSDTLKANGLHVTRAVIPHDTKVTRAQKQSAEGRVKSIFNFARSPAAAGYRALLEEIGKETAPHVNYQREQGRGQGTDPGAADHRGQREGSTGARPPGRKARRRRDR